MAHDKLHSGWHRRYLPLSTYTPFPSASVTGAHASLQMRGCFIRVTCKNSRARLDHCNPRIPVTQCTCRLVSGVLQVLRLKCWTWKQ
ncbi:hypothetical protein E2C01_096114 [Portunus trituberculatus]|uniref:Uncharacterized protein n=1 Tax=Portunus trituberculatus TaxID=210409 RepID=A0A5B7K627_PORTR|nr:hypothetical protein [Portunus trituberculatus]